MIDLTGKVLLITGAGRGIGAACARAAAAAGAEVVLHDVRAEAPADLSDRCTAISADLADPSVVPDL